MHKNSRPCLRVVLAGLLAGLAWPTAAAGIEGLWITANGDARVEIGPCDDELCGRVRWLKRPVDENGNDRRDSQNPDEELRERTLVGLAILSGVSTKPDADGVWRGASIYDPKSGRTYRCKLRLDGEDRLKLRGFLGISLLGKTTYWKRVDREGGS